ncbi:hypothetical protein E4K72_10900 [Oxalobacteraceae bacterium OM1]|nr:hypothetical protein E4K72_10900 [Oxalobacteraceae bacterium OM1]
MSFHHRHVIRALLCIGLSLPFAAGAADGAKGAAGTKLDKYLPAKLAGWRTDPPSDPDNMGDHTLAVNQTFSSKDQESGLDIGIQRILPASRIGLPKLEQAKLGRNAEGGVDSMQQVKGIKALLGYDAGNRSGKLVMVAGTYVVSVDGNGVTQAQLMAAADGVDLKGLSEVCR